MAKSNSKEYASQGGVYCPVCGSEDIEGYDTEFDIGMAWQNCTCAACKSEWTDTYTLTGYDNLEEVSGHEQNRHS